MKVIVILVPDLPEGTTFPQAMNQLATAINVPSVDPQPLAEKWDYQNPPAAVEQRGNLETQGFKIIGCPSSVAMKVNTADVPALVAVVNNLTNVKDIMIWPELDQ